MFLSMLRTLVPRPISSSTVGRGTGPGYEGICCMHEQSVNHTYLLRQKAVMYDHNGHDLANTRLHQLYMLESLVGIPLLSQFVSLSDSRAS